MIFLGVDWGERRIGLATANSECPIATILPTITLAKSDNAIKAIMRARTEVSADVIVLGLPLDLSGKRGAKAKVAEKLADDLRAENLNVILWDERLTTEESRHLLVDAGISRKQRGKYLDGMAAQRILSSYLSANENKT